MGNCHEDSAHEWVIVDFDGGHYETCERCCELRSSEDARRFWIPAKLFPEIKSEKDMKPFIKYAVVSVVPIPGWIEVVDVGPTEKDGRVLGGD
jgi:hypothetical protein